MNFFGKYFKLNFFLTSLTFVLSFAAFLYTPLNKVGFFIILLLTLILSVKKKEYGLYILLAELFVGSKGYLFYFEFGEISISLRIALFAVVFLVWLYQRVRLKNLRLKLNKWWWIFFIFVGWGFLWGVISNNGFKNVFFDFNGWLYFALIGVFATVIKSKRQIENIVQILTASVLVITLKTFFLLYIFSHQIEFVARPLYRWLRVFLIGEITLMDNGLHRIFFQSQIYVLIAFFIFLSFLVWQLKDKIPLKQFIKNNWRLYLLASGAFASILISFSRSFWVGILFGSLSLFIFLIIFKTKIKNILKVSMFGLSIILTSFLFIWVAFKFPFPNSPISFSFSSMFEDRLTDYNEAAVRSRWDLLPPLGKAIVNHPVIGSGFGETVTYKSSDPRALEINPTGEFTTYAFEWGYLDIMLKIGLAGLLVYLYLIWRIFKGKWKLIKDTDNILSLGLFTGMISLLAVNFFSPYLNHPLGIGYIVLCSIILFIFNKEKLNTDCKNFKK